MLVDVVGPFHVLLTSQSNAFFGFLTLFLSQTESER